MTKDRDIQDGSEGDSYERPPPLPKEKEIARTTTYIDPATTDPINFVVVFSRTPIESVDSRKHGDGGKKKKKK